MEWIVALAALLAVVALLPATVRWSKSSVKKGNAGGVVMIMGMIFAGLFDPARKAAVEEIAKKKEVGEEADVADGGLE